MKMNLRAACIYALVNMVTATTSPISKVFSMLSDLQSSIKKEGQVAQSQFEKFEAWCVDRAKDVGFEITTGKTDVENLKASIAEETAHISSLTTKIDELAADIAQDDADLKAATAIRSKEAADFAAAEKELLETIDVIGRASGVLEREMRKGTSMMQLQRASNLAQALSVMIQASLIGSSDASKLTALVQESQKEQNSDDDDGQGAPAAAVYTSQSGNIVDTLEDLGEKAQGQLSEARKQEVSARHNFEMLKQSLEDEIEVSKRDMEDAKKGLASSSEKKSVAEGGLEAASKDLAEDIKTQAELQRTCSERAESFHAESKSRDEELRALAEAEDVLRDATSELQVSFVQLSVRSEVKGFKAVRFVRDLARRHHSTQLAQLASRIASAVKSGNGSPFSKVKGLISDMITRLEKDAEADATEKAFCDKELADSSEKKTDRVDEITKMTNSVDQMSAKSARLKEEVATLESELSKLARSQAEMDKMRQAEKNAFGTGKEELTKNLQGVELAIKILRDYYGQDGKAHSAKEGSAGGIIGLLETIEADLSKTLAMITSDEEAAVTEHEEMSKDNEIEKTMKEQDVKYKVKESKQLDQTSSELKADRSGVQAELDAVDDYLTKMQARCIAKPEAYEARAARRAAEIAGLKEALAILESETAFVQKRVSRVKLGGRGFLRPV